MANLAVAQLRCAVGDVPTNLQKAKELIAEASGQGRDVVCLPECFTTGLVHGRTEELAEPVPGPSSQVWCQAAADGGLWVVAGMAEREGERLYNTGLVISPQVEVVARYHNCFLYMQEADLFTRGSEPCVLDLGFITAGITICYD